MRPFSKYLTLLKSETIPFKYNLGGSTPPTPSILNKKSFRITVDEAKKLGIENQLRKVIAQKTKQKIDNINLYPASTQSCFQVLAAHTQPGDTIMIESPAYEPYLATAEFLGLNIVRFQRTGYFSYDFENIKRQAPRAKVVLISNPHCPTGWMYTKEQIYQIAQECQHLVVDEVFRPLFTKGEVSLVDTKRPSNVTSISSLSKSAGLSNIRLGWSVSEPEWAAKYRSMGLHLHIDTPFPSQQIALTTFKKWTQVIRAQYKRADHNRKLLKKIYQTKPELFSHNFNDGYFVMIKVPPPFMNGKSFSQELQKKSILVRDGACFEMPEYIRLHLLLPEKDFKKFFQVFVSYF